MRRVVSDSGKWGGVNTPASRSFDAHNNITTYKGTSSTAPSNLSWTRGNMLGGGNLSGKEFEYKYGPDNLRYSKKVDGTETVYYWDNDVLMGEKTGNNVTEYLYDADGIVGMIYNKNYFYFEKNLYGDVLKVYNSSGNPVAIFEYDSYGNVISETGNMADRTHFRYRGYYYDEETGFYYLQSRYYDPSICRFISADQYELVGALSDTVGQLNLYAYCNNNPIMYTDPSGEIVFSTIGAMIGVIAGVILGGYVGYTILTQNPSMSTWERLAVIGVSVVGGGLLGWVGGGVIGGILSGSGLSHLISTMMTGGIQSASGAAAYGVVAISLEEAAIMGVAVGVAGVGVMYIKGYGARPGHNQHENEQFRDAMRELGGYDKTSPEWEKGHRALMKYKKSGKYIDKYKELLDFLRKAIDKKG